MTTGRVNISQTVWSYMERCGTFIPSFVLFCSIFLCPRLLLAFLSFAWVLCLFYCRLKTDLHHNLPVCRRLTSVSWDRPRQPMSTVSSVARWGQFTCSERLLALLKSWPSISWAQDTRFEEEKKNTLKNDRQIWRLCVYFNFILCEQQLSCQSGSHWQVSIYSCA